MSNEIRIEENGNALVVTFRRPEIRSPLSIQVLEQLYQLVDRLEGNQNFDQLVFTGVDDVFASGADLREIAAVTAENANEFALRGQTLMTRIASLSQTTIAAINGYCFGGALDLALACDRRIASPNASFAHPGAGLGIITGWGGTQRLPRLIGTAFSLEMFFTAAPVAAHRALEIGLIDKINADPLGAALTDRKVETVWSPT